MFLWTPLLQKKKVKYKKKISPAFCPSWHSTLSVHSETTGRPQQASYLAYLLEVGPTWMDSTV